jgi:hypothetical protein
MKNITQARLRELFDYDPHTGSLTWKRRTSNRVTPNGTAGTITPDGRVVVRVDGQTYRAHRLIWLWMTGSWPEKLVDHIDCNASNNSWDNLREATNQENLLNRGANKNNTTGLKGVTYDKRTGRWSAQIKHNRKNFFLGRFKTPEQAHQAYVSAVVRFHGDFARAS